MNNATKSIIIFGIYLITAGILLTFFPNPLLTLFGLPATNEIWIRLGGLLIAILGGYYLQAARHRFVPFYRATVYGRIIFGLGIFSFVLLGLAPPILSIIGFVDIITACFTLVFLKQN